MNTDDLEDFDDLVGPVKEAERGKGPNTAFPKQNGRKLEDADEEISIDENFNEFDSKNRLDSKNPAKGGLQNERTNVKPGETMGGMGTKNGGSGEGFSEELDEKRRKVNEKRVESKGNYLPEVSEKTGLHPSSREGNHKYSEGNSGLPKIKGEDNSTSQIRSKGLVIERRGDG
jgi:hypothetical protein